MIINLSSQNETDPAKFSNSFSETIDIQPFSYICLIKGQIIRSNNQDTVAIPANTPLYIRYNCYDIHTIMLNPGATADLNVTMSVLADLINNTYMINAGIPFNKSVRFTAVEDDDNNESLQITFYNFTSPPIAGIKWKEYIFGGDTNYWDTKFGQITGANNVLAMPPNAIAGNNLNYLYSNAGEWGVAPIWDSLHYTPPTNQFNKNSFNLLVDPNFNTVGEEFGYDPMQFWINQGNPEFYLSFGKTTTDENDPPITLTGPIQNTPGHEPTLDPKNNLLVLFFNYWVNNQLQLYHYDSDTNDFSTDAILTTVNPGDYFEVETLPTPEVPESEQKLYYFQVTQHATTGLLFAYNGNLGEAGARPGGGDYLLSANITSPVDKSTQNNMSFIYDNEYLKRNYIKQLPNAINLSQQWLTDFRQTTADWGGNSCIGERTNYGFPGSAQQILENPGWVYNRENLTRPETVPFVLAYQDAVSDYSQWRYSPSVLSFNNNDGLQRADGSAIEIPNAYRVSINPYICNVPTLICCSCSFQLLAETMIPSNLDPNIRTIMGCDNERLLEIQLNQGATALPAGWDWRLTDNTGVTHVGILVDAGGNRINFTSSDNINGYTYNFFLRWYGGRTVASRSFQITVKSMAMNAGGNTSNTYDIPAVVPLPLDTYPNDFNTFGGINPITDVILTNYNDYSPLTYMCNFRIYQHSGNESDTDVGWDNIVAQLSDGWNLVPNYAVSNDWFTDAVDLRPQLEFFPHAVSNILIPTPAMGTDNRYTNIGCPNSLTNTGVIIEKMLSPLVIPPKDLAVPLINGLWIPPLNLSKNTNRTLNLSSNAYSEMGEGFVDVTSAPVIDFTSPLPDVGNNILQVGELTADQGPNNPTSTVLADVQISSVENEALNIEITNLTHRTMNGTNRSMDKTIYQMPMLMNKDIIGNQEVIEVVPPSKVWIPLNNPGSMPINRLDVQISQIDGRKATLFKDTNVSLQLEHDKTLLN